MGEIDFSGILVLELFQAAARAAVAQAFPFGAGHLLQRLGFPKESLLIGGRRGTDGHVGLGLRRGRGQNPLRGAPAPLAAATAGALPKAPKPLTPAPQNVRPRPCLCAPPASKNT